MMHVATEDAAARIDAALAQKPDGILEAVAAACEASLLDVLNRLPREAAIPVDGAAFEKIWASLVEWGDVLLIVHTKDMVLECTAPLPPGTTGHGYFNIHGDSPVGGHIKATNCRTIVFVDRPFHGRRSCSIQFLNEEGNAMLKIFVRRDTERNLVPDQLQRFEALRSSLV